MPAPLPPRRMKRATGAASKSSSSAVGTKTTKKKATTKRSTGKKHGHASHNMDRPVPETLPVKASSKRDGGSGRRGTQMTLSEALSTITFSLTPGDGEPNFHRAAQLEDGTYLTFNGTSSSALVSIGNHTLRWWAAGDVEEKFSLELTGQIKAGVKESGAIPAGKITGGMIDFEAVAS